MWLPHFEFKVIRKLDLAFQIVTKFLNLSLKCNPILHKKVLSRNITIKFVGIHLNYYCYFTMGVASMHSCEYHKSSF